MAFLLVVLLGVQGRPNMMEWGKSVKHLIMRAGTKSESFTLGTSFASALKPSNTMPMPRYLPLKGLSII